MSELADIRKATAKVNRRRRCAGQCILIDLI